MSSKSFKRSSIYFVFLISGCLGYFFGTHAECNWQHAVEGAQVIAGLVRYPSANPFFMYQVKAWTLLHQLLAVFLRLGCTERSLSIFMSGVMGVLSLQALSLLTLCFTRNKWTAILAPLFICYSSIYAFGTTYAVSLMGTMTTYGVVGMAWMMLTFAFLSLGENAVGGWMLGIAPAIHPTLGAFAWLIVSIASWCDHSEMKQRWKPLCIYFLAGCFFSAVSFFIYHWQVTHWLPHGMVIDQEIFSSFVKLWDGHRAPVPLNSEDTYFNLMVMLIAVSYLTRFRAELFPESRFILWFFIVSSTLGMAAMVFTWMPVEKMPVWLVSMMPGRILTIAIYGYGPLMVGLADRYRGNRAADLFLVFFLLVLLCVVRGVQLDFIILLFLLIFFAVLFLGMKWMGWIKLESDEAHPKTHSRILHLGILLAFTMSTAAHFYHAWRLVDERRADLKDRTNDATFAQIAQQKNELLLLGPDVGSIQLLTRRPVVIDIGAMDGMAYVPEAGAANYQIMKEIYGIDLKGVNEGQIPDQTLFESRSTEEWIRLAKKYHFTEILVGDTWHLKLPLVLRTFYALYRIPNLAFYQTTSEQQDFNS